MARLADGVPDTFQKIGEIVNSLNPRVLAAVAICALIVAAALSGCSAGQQAETAAIVPDVNGSMADVNDIALRNIRIRADPTGYAVTPGRSVDLALVVTNQSPVTADKIVTITSGIGKVILVGNTAIPPGGILIVDSPDRANVDALASVKPVNAATATVILSKPISHGLTYDVTFEFAHAETVTVGVPIVSPETDVPATLPYDGESLRE